jgi:hypothetical protein
MTKTRISATLYELASKAGVAGLAYMALVGGSTGAGNLLQFIAWVVGIAGMLIVFIEPTTPPGPRSYVPRWFGAVFTAAVIAALAWHGWWATAVAWSFGALGSSAYLAQQRKKFPDEAAA